MIPLRRSFVGFCLVVLLAIMGMWAARCRAAADDGPAAREKQEKSAKIGSVDLRPFLEGKGLKTRVQGSRNTCSVFTLAGALEYALAKKNGKCDAPLSVEFLNWASNQANGVLEDGSYFSDLWKGFENHGACPEADMPYRDEFDPETRPSDEARARAKPLRGAGFRIHWIKYWNPNVGLTDRQFENVKRALELGWPVCGGFLWPKNGQQQWNDGVLEMRPRDQVRDGHSVLLVGYRDDPNKPGGGVFLIRNSDGQFRDGAMSYEYVKAYMNDAIWIDDVDREEDPSARQWAPRAPRRKPWWLR
ncbi:MAG: C1 family peptidase [Pirellulales bacterium]|nr:C1 family peptidase [Pirellulales bacterium]